jgi:hypothetical protein
MKTLPLKVANPFAIGIGLLSVPVFSLMITSLLFVCGLSINPFIFPVSIILSCLLMFFVLQKNRKDFCVATSYFLFIILFSVTISVIFYDFSSDGHTYHQEAIFLLKTGWNPVYEHHALDAKYGIWISHYAKGLETISATIYSTTNNIEAGKAVNFILVLASAFLFFSFLKVCYETLSLRKKILLSVLFTLCPVVVVQILTYYIDWAAYSLLLILVCSLICSLKGHQKYNFLIIGSVIFLSTTIKFNLFFWILYTTSIYLIYAIFIKQYQFLKKLMITAVVSSIIAVFIAGFNPYITNIKDHKNPFYPLAGEGKVNIINCEFKDNSRFTSVFISLFSLPNNHICLEVSEETKLTVKHFISQVTFDTRAGGFGIFFSLVLVMSIILYIKLALRKNKNRIKYDIFLLMLFISLFVLPFAWWARYFPFIYAFPLIIILYSEIEERNKYVNIFRNLMYMLLIINTVIIILCISAHMMRYMIRTYDIIAVLAKSENPVLINFNGEGLVNVGFKIKLDENNIKYIESSELLGTRAYLSPDILLDSTKYASEKKYSILGKEFFYILVEKKK